MKCFKTILRCMRPMGGALNIIYLSIIGPTEPFSTKVGSQISHKMPHFQYAASQCRKWDDVLPGETSIAHEVSQNLL